MPHLASGLWRPHHTTGLWGQKPLQVSTVRFEVSGEEKAGKGYGREGEGKAPHLKEALPEQTTQVGGQRIGRNGFLGKRDGKMPR